MFRFFVNEVDSCPLNKTAWESASARLNCSSDKSRINRYHCVPNEEKTSLTEFCYDYLSGLYESDHCIYLSHSGFLNKDKPSCRNFRNGCPSESYLGDEIYKYPACLQINTVNKCYLADDLCPNPNREVTTPNTETTFRNLSVSSEITDTPNAFHNITTTMIPEAVLGIPVVVVYIATVVLITVLVIAMVLCKRYRKKDEANEEAELKILIDTTQETKFLAENQSKLMSDRHAFLYLFLFVDKWCLSETDLHQNTGNWIDKLNKIRILFNFETISKQDAIDQLNDINRNDIGTYLSWFGEEIRFKTQDAMDEIFFRFSYCREDSNINSSHIHLLFEENAYETIRYYFRVAGYKSRCAEKYICLPVDFTDLMIRVLREKVITLGDKDDPQFLQQVSDTLKIPVEILLFEEKDFRSYAEQIAKGKEKMFYGRGMLVGCGGTGKTTLLQRLKNENMTKSEIKNLNIHSTVGVDVFNDVFIVDEDNMTIRENKEQIASCFPRPSDMKMLAEHSADSNHSEITSACSESDIDISNESSISFVSFGTTPDSENEYDQGNVEEVVSNDVDYWSEEDMIIQFEKKNEMHSEIDTPKHEQLKMQNNEADMSKEKYNIEEALKQMILSAPAENLKLISIMDFAGQCIYYPCHQIHMNPRAFYILCVNMAIDLESEVEENDSDQKGTLFEKKKYIDYVNFWLKLLYIYSSPTKSTSKNFQTNSVRLSVPLILVATHADEASIDLSTFRERLSKRLDVGFDLNNIYMLGFPSSSRDYDQVHKLKKAIASIVTRQEHWGELLPKSWMLFEGHIRFAKRTGKKILSFYEIETINSNLNENVRMNSIDDLVTMLRFFHNVGLILFFKEAGIADTIIVDIQWFVDAFKHIIMDKKHFCHIDANVYLEWKNNFYFTGELQDTLLTRIWTLEEHRHFLQHKDVLLMFMQRLGMLVESKRNKTSKETNAWYYVPCMNKRVFNRNVHFKNIGHPSSIFCFRFQILPTYIFYHLVVLCVGTTSWTFVHNKTDKSLYGTASLLKFKNHCYVEIGICKQDLEVRISSTENESVPDVVKIETVHFLENVMKKILEMYHMSLTYCIGYKCRKTDFCDESREDKNFIQKAEIEWNINKKPLCSCQYYHRYDPSDLLWEVSEQPYNARIMIQHMKFKSLAKLVYSDIQNLRLDKAFELDAWHNSDFQREMFALLQEESSLELLFLEKRYVTPEIMSQFDGQDLVTSFDIDVVRKKLMADITFHKISENTFEIRAISWVIAYGLESLLKYIVQHTDLSRGISEEKDAARLLKIACLSFNCEVLNIAISTWKNGINNTSLYSGDPMYNAHRLCTPLTAASHFNTSAINTFLEAGAELMVKDQAGNTAVSILIEKKDWDSFRNCFCSKPEFNNIIIHGDPTVLHLAVEYDSPLDIFLWLLKGANNVDVINSRDETTLHIAVGLKRMNHVALLIQQNANVNAVDQNGNSPLLIAIERNSVDIVKTLIEHGAHVNYDDYTEMSPLISAAEKGYTDIARVLLKYGADINHEDWFGATPLFSAAENGHLNVVKYLYNLGADINIPDYLGSTPLLAAQTGFHFDICEYLSQK